MNFRFTGDYVFPVMMHLLGSGRVELPCYKLLFRICISVHRCQIHPHTYTGVNGL